MTPTPQPNPPVRVKVASALAIAARSIYESPSNKGLPVLTRVRWI